MEKTKKQMQIIITKEELMEILKKAIKETSWGKEISNPRITFVNKRNDGETNVESAYPITHLIIE